MKENNARSRQTVKFLKWIRKNSGWWYLICTPNEEHMSLEMMQNLIKNLYDASFFELIFVLIMVHRDEPFMKNLPDYLDLDWLIEHWEEEQERLVKAMVNHLD